MLKGQFQNFLINRICQIPLMFLQGDRAPHCGKDWSSTNAQQSKLIVKAYLLCWLLRGRQVSHQTLNCGIHSVQSTKHARDGSTLTLKPRADVTRHLKHGYQWPRRKDLDLPFFFLKMNINRLTSGKRTINYPSQVATFITRY